MLQSWLMWMRDGTVNLAAIVGWIFFAIGTIPLVFFVSVDRARKNALVPAKASSGSKKSAADH